MIEALWQEALAVLLAIVAAVALKAFGTWWASDPAKARAKRLDQTLHLSKLLNQPGVYVGVTRKQGAITEEYGPWPDRLRLRIQIWVWRARRNWLPAGRWEAKQSAESEAALRRERPELFE